jgi:uncharacterized protein (TIGR02117 family)
MTTNPAPLRPPFFVRWWRRLTNLLALIVLIPVIYLAAGFGLGTITRKGTTKDKSGIDVWIVSNGMHTSVVLPATGAGYDLAAFFGLPTGPAAPRRLMIGWGDREFFERVPEWQDLTAEIAAGAAFGMHASALSVTRVDDSPDLFTDSRRLKASPDQIRSLATFIKDTAEQRPGGGAQQFILNRDTPGETFYRARGHYHLIRTCNQWTTEALAAADLPRGFWTPFAPSVMRHWPLTKAGDTN